MKENFNIDELFKQKFDNFQPDVDPSVWANIQAGIGAGATGAAVGGISAAVKIGLISGGIIAASVATWYFGFYEPTAPVENITQQTVVSEPVQNPAQTNNELIIVRDSNVLTTYEIPTEQRLDVEPNTISGQQQSNVVNSNGNTTTTTVSNTTAGNTSTTVNPVNNNQQITPVTNENTGITADGKKELLPTGRMEFTQTTQYAPSAVSFVSNARNFEEVHWDFGDGSVAEGTDVKHTYAKPGKYEVRMTIVGEKTTYEETQELAVKTKSGIDNVPNVITPDGDRINDVFSIKSTDIEKFQIVITDKRGNEVFTSNDKDFVWDGTDFSGQTVEKGAYTYVIIAEGKDGSVIKLPGQVYVQ